MTLIMTMMSSVTNIAGIYSSSSQVPKTQSDYKGSREYLFIVQREQ